MVSEGAPTALKVQALPTSGQTPEELAPYMTLLRAVAGQRQFYPLATMPGECPGASELSVATAIPAALPARITLLERHPHTAQNFLSLSAGRWMIAVAPALVDGTPDLARLQAYMAGPDDAVCIHRNVWHAPLTVFGDPADFAMLMWRSAERDDTVLFSLPTAISCLLP